MSDNDTCPICLAEYTTSDTHRPASLKCGHLFGFLCLKNWFNTARTALCPACSKPSRVSEIRVIFASSVKCIDSEKENEIMDRYLNEKNKTQLLSSENAQLKISIDLLQTELRKLEKTIVDMTVLDFSNESEVPFFSIFKEHKIGISYAIVSIDKANNNLFIAFRDRKSVGYLKAGYNYDNISYSSVFVRVPDFSFVNEMKISNFNDSLILICYNRSVKLINSITENVIVNIDCENRVRAVSYGRTNLDCIFIGDEKGFLFVYCLKSLEFTKKGKIEGGIHSIQLINDSLFVASIHKWYLVKDRNDPIEFEDLNLSLVSTCIYLTGYNNYLFMTIKQGVYKTSHKIYEIKSGSNEIKEIKTIANISQFSKYRNKIYDSNLFVIDENENSLVMFFIGQKKRFVLYKGKGKIIDFDISEEVLVVLELGNLIILKRDKV